MGYVQRRGRYGNLKIVRSLVFFVDWLHCGYWQGAVCYCGITLQILIETLIIVSTFCEWGIFDFGLEFYFESLVCIMYSKE